MKNAIRKICFIEPKFLRSIGGIETHSYEFVKYFMENKNYKIDSIISKKDIKDGINLKIRNKRFEKITKRILIGNIKKDVKAILKNSINSEIYFFNSPNWILTARHIKEEKPNSKIFVRSGGNDIIAGWILNEKDNLNKLEDNRKKIVEIINNYVDKLIVNSKYSRKRMISVGIKKKKIKIISGGVDCKTFSPEIKRNFNDKNIKIGFWGRLVEFKGLEYSLKAINEVYKEYKSIEFDIIGDGPERKKILDLISKMNLKNIVKYRGIMEFNKIPLVARDFDIFLHLPIYLKKIERGSNYIHTETMGRTYCEANSMGIPSVISNVGGGPEMIINNKTGFIVKEKDYLEASKKILKLINNPRLRKKLGRKARKISLKRYNWNKLINKYEKVFRK
jgi:glycosyltransferase involved in cell wall biosynthesis